jgi:hypothetical protein
VSSPKSKVKTRALDGALTSGTLSAAITGVAYSAIFPAAELEKQRAVRLSVLSSLVVLSFLIGLVLGWTALTTGRVSAVWKNYCFALCSIIVLGLFSGMPWVATLTALALVGGSTLVAALLSIWLARRHRTSSANSE